MQINVETLSCCKWTYRNLVVIMQKWFNLREVRLKKKEWWWQFDIWFKNIDNTEVFYNHSKDQA